MYSSKAEIGQIQVNSIASREEVQKALLGFWLILGLLNPQRLTLVFFSTEYTSREVPD